jgi:serine/threonine protein kinase
VGNYQFIIPLGSGTEGTVYMARNIVDQEIYAVKVYNEGFDANREIVILKSIKHPNVIKIYENGFG